MQKMKAFRKLFTVLIDFEIYKSNCFLSQHKAILGVYTCVCEHTHRYTQCCFFLNGQEEGPGI